MLSAAHNHIRHFRLLDLQIRLRLEYFAHLQAVGLFVALRPRRPDGGSTRSVEQTKLDSDRVRDFAHDATESVHFAHQVPLGDAADGGVTRHLRDQIDVQRIESGLQPQASRRHRGFASGMTSPHHHHLEMFVKRLHVRLFRIHSKEEREYCFIDCNNVLCSDSALTSGQPSLASIRTLEGAPSKLRLGGGFRWSMTRLRTRCNRNTKRRKKSNCTNPDQG